MAEKIQIKLNRDKSPSSSGKLNIYRERELLKETKVEEKGARGVRNSQKSLDQDRQEIVEDRGRSEVRELDEAGNDENGVAESDEMDEMLKLMGFGGFSSTKNKKVEGTNAFGASKHKNSEYRQYMNRAKGFNRSLSPTLEEKKKKKSNK